MDTKDQRLSVPQLIAFSGIGFLVLVSYGLARPSVETTFNVAYGKEGLPWVWIAVAFTAVITVMSYNRYASRVGLLRLFLWASGISIVLFEVLLFLHRKHTPGADFILYVWKDVYIVVLVEIFWTYANQVFPIGTARWLYGLFLLAGAGGSVVAELGVGVIAERWGTERAVWAVVPLLLTLAVGCVPLARVGGAPGVTGEKGDKPGVAEAFSVVRTSRYVALLLALIAVTQIVITLVDYQFNAVVAEHVPDQDARTAVIGQVYATISTAVLVLNALTGVVLKYVGVARTLIAIPGILALALVGAVVGPIFAAMVVAKVASKAFDYSVFRAAKEILYIPLSPIEKTRGKAIVDMLGYRVAKGVASLLILALTTMDALTAVLGMTFVFTAVWIRLTVVLVRGFEARRPDASP